MEMEHGAEVKPGKHSDTAIKPLHPNGHLRPLAVGGWGMTVAYNRHKSVALLKRMWLCNGHFASEAAVFWIQKWFKIPAGTSRKFQMRIHRTVYGHQGGVGRRGYGVLYKAPGGSKWGSRPPYFHSFASKTETATKRPFLLINTSESAARRTAVIVQKRNRHMDPEVINGNPMKLLKS
jgi:hypothetical protein